MASSALRDDLDHARDIVIGSEKSAKLLPVAAIYGANAAGKTNMLDALVTMRSHLLWHFSDPVPEALEYTPFKLEKEAAENPSSYDCDLVVENVRYHYGYSIIREGVVTEWLYSYPKGVKTIMFERDFKRSDPTYIGPSLKGMDKHWKAQFGNRKRLLLSAADPLNHEILTPILDAFTTKLMAVRISGEPPETKLIEDLEALPSIRQRLLSFLRNGDAGIVDLEIETGELGEDALRFREKILGIFRSEVSDIRRLESQISEKTKSLYLHHRGSDGEIYKLHFDRESSGTRYLMSLLVPVIVSLSTGSLLIVDEITTNLHTKLSEQILGLFSSEKTNPHNAQFLFSTHDTNLLSRSILRRDEVWFAEKAPTGATVVYPLTDFGTRASDNIEKGYLEGRFGAIPFLGQAAAYFTKHGE
ncbi:AAA family ATPase [Cupriavidus plantarum]|uniref:AAA family ATPase n=1 Tax=Cupriavidus plantarum TaxID=942865 RepID=UPI00339D7FDC